jgi:hypothetical protein
MSGVIGTNPNMNSGVIGAFAPQAEKWVFNTSTSSPGYITANLSRFTGVGTNYIGRGMTESSGVFTFPSTGLWEVSATAGFYSYVYQNYVSINIHTTTNNSSYVLANVNYVIHPGDASNRNLNGHTMQTILFGVKDTSNYKVKFQWERESATVTLRGASNYEDTGFGFKKIAPISALRA